MACVVRLVQPIHTARREKLAGRPGGGCGSYSGRVTDSQSVAFWLMLV